MFGMVNVDMIFFVIKEKLNEILTGQPIDGFKIVSNDENTIVCVQSNHLQIKTFKKLKEKFLLNTSKKILLLNYE